MNAFPQSATHAHAYKPRPPKSGLFPHPGRAILRLLAKTMIPARLTGGFEGPGSEAFALERLLHSEAARRFGAARVFGVLGAVERDTEGTLEMELARRIAADGTRLSLHACYDIHGDEPYFAVVGVGPVFGDASVGDWDDTLGALVDFLGGDLREELPHADR